MVSVGGSTAHLTVGRSCFRVETVHFASWNIFHGFFENHASFDSATFQL